MPATVMGFTTPGPTESVNKNSIDTDPRWKGYGIRPGKFGYDMQRYLGLDLFPGARGQATFASGLEPGRQDAIANYLMALSPGGEFARTERGAAAMLNQGAGAGEQGAQAALAQGFGPEYALAIRNAQIANAIRSANTYRAGIGDRMNDAYERMLGVYSKGQEAPLLSQVLLPLLFANKVGQQPKQPDNTLGTIAGLAGAILGGPIGGKLFGGK